MKVGFVMVNFLLYLINFFLGDLEISRRTFHSESGFESWQNLGHFWLIQEILVNAKYSQPQLPRQRK